MFQNEVKIWIWIRKNKTSREPLFDIEVDHKMVLITCKVKRGGATGDTDESLITEGCNHPIGVWENGI